MTESVIYACLCYAFKSYLIGLFIRSSCGNKNREVENYTRMSEYCSNCGATDFTPVDGFFYCAVCNTQSQVRKYEAFLFMMKVKEA